VIEKIIPTESHKRRALLILKDSELNILKQSDEFKPYLFSDEITVIEYPACMDIEQESDSFNNLKASDLIRPNSILVQSPYDKDVYVQYDKATETFAIEKVHMFSKLCQLLGSKHVETEQVEINRGDRTSTFSLKAGQESSAIGFVGDIESKNNLAFTREFRVSSQMVGAEADIEAAIEFLREKHLYGDEAMRNLVELRSHQKNPILEHRVTISLTSEVSSALNVVAKMKLPESFSVGAGYISKSNKEEEYLLTLHVRF